MTSPVHPKEMIPKRLTVKELLTGFCHIKSFVQNPECPISWTLAFTIHTILIAVFEVQGSNHGAFLAETAQSTFYKYNLQLASIAKIQLAPIQRRPPHWDANITSHYKIYNTLSVLTFQ
jgi:hypothetical protein